MRAAPFVYMIKTFKMETCSNQIFHVVRATEDAECRWMARFNMYPGVSKSYVRDPSADRTDLREARP